MASTEILIHLHQENARVAAVFWEWRQKVLSFTALGSSGLVALAGWIYSHSLGHFVAVPLMLIAFIAFVAIWLERRNRTILGDCYRVGADLEEQLGQPATFSALHNDGVRPMVSYTQAILLLLSFLALTFTVLGVGSLAWGWFVAEPRHQP